MKKLTINKNITKTYKIIYKNLAGEFGKTRR